MDQLEIILILVSPAIVLMLFIAKLLWDLVQRTTKVETNVTMIISWVACLNGEMSDEKEFQLFLKKLKKVNKENLKNIH